MPKGRILAVDDQRYFRELVEGLLSEEGFETQTASSGEEALRLLEQSHFDIVLTDLVMPGMDGSELVHRIKQRDPEQDVVVVTGVVDVKTAVEAMKLGATDYLLKPFDRTTLASTLENILQRRRLRAEHGRLLAENIEYLGERSLFERAIGLFSRLSVPALAENLVEALCFETEAQGGVIWIAREDDGSRLGLTAARGLVRVEEEQEVLEPADAPVGLRDGEVRSLLREGGEEGSRSELYLALRRDGRLIALVRLGDKLGGETFDTVDQSCAEKLARFAEVALANAMRFRDLERRTLEDPTTGAYIFQYFHDVARNEIEKSNRFGRSFSLLKLDPGPLERLRRERGVAQVSEWLTEVVKQLRQLLRATDLLAVDSHQRFWALLPEADAVGAAAFKQRAHELLAQSPLFSAEPAEGPHLAAATYPGDGTQLESLTRVLEARLAEDRRSRPRIRELARLGFADSLHVLLREGQTARPEMGPQIARFALDEVGRRPLDRALLFVAPGRVLSQPVMDGLESLSGLPSGAEIAVIAEGEKPTQVDPDVSWVSPRRTPGVPPFVIHFGDGPAYALVQEESEAGAEPRLFHTQDRGLVEHLAFRLQRELSLPSRLDPSPAQGWRP